MITKFAGSKFRHYTKKDGIRQQSIIDIYQDGNDTIYFLTIRSQIYYYAEKTDRIGRILVDSVDREKLAQKELCSFLKEDDGGFRMGFTRNGGSCLIDRDKRVQFFEDTIATGFKLEKHPNELHLSSNCSG